MNLHTEATPESYWNHSWRLTVTPGTPTLCIYAEALLQTTIGFTWRWHRAPETQNDGDLQVKFCVLNVTYGSANPERKPPCVLCSLLIFPPCPAAHTFSVTLAPSILVPSCRTTLRLVHAIHRHD